MWRAALKKFWEPQKIYYTKLFQELYVGLAITGYIFYKISYGGKKKVEDKPTPAHH
ncbi:ATP synthase F(0) complex subunit j, mitochondrial [Paroedura picta]|uniref:ATP synthase F(0) complex subunit j, mitochondrial n=1 Tax=Paroedura picta TaxID=143630 RepID=UPI0040576574